MKSTGKPDSGAMETRAAIARAAVLLAAILFALGLVSCDKKKRHRMGDLLVLHETPLKWRELEPGLGLAELRFQRESTGRGAELVAVRADPQKFSFKVLDAPGLLQAPSAYVHELAMKAEPVIAVNGSFYLPVTFEPIGLVVSGGEVKNNWKKGAGSGVFTVKDKKASIDWSRDYKKSWESSEVVLQAGPLIIEPGGKEGIYNNVEKYRSRTAVGIDREGRAVLVGTLRVDEMGGELSGLDLHELMAIMRAPPEKGGLGLDAALNLDGGTSTGMSVSHPSFRVEIKSAHPVPNAIAVHRRKKADTK